MKTNGKREREQRHILLCVAGLTPQIITETLYALTQLRGERVDEIRVITTLDGRDRIMTGVVNGRGRAEESLLHPEVGRFYAFCRDFKIDPQSIKFDEKTISLLHTRDGLTLPNIRTPRENELAGDRVCEIVRELTKAADTRIHASAAGGRKTMGIYLTAAMQLFGRVQDTLSHVLVNEDFEGNPNFYYPPPKPIKLQTRDGREVSTKDAQIYLAPIPFIRLRGVRSNWLDGQSDNSYGQIVESAQTTLDLFEREYDLNVDLKRSRLVIGQGRLSINLAPRELFFYTMFALFRAEARGGDGVVSLLRLRRADFDRTFRQITAAKGREAGLDDISPYPKFDFLDEMLKQLASGGAEAMQEFMAKFYVLNSRIKKKDCPISSRSPHAKTGERLVTSYPSRLRTSSSFSFPSFREIGKLAG
jgi:CRISPR-associated protein (TIGR02584 family)